MKNFFIFALGLLCCCFSSCLKPPDILFESSAGTILPELAEVEPILPDIVAAAELRSRPDIILKAYEAAYPEIIVDVVFLDGDWALELNDGMFYYWANGRFLPAEKRQQWETFRSHQIYPYSGKPRNPDLYTPEHIETLRKIGSRENRSAPQPPLESGFLRSLLGLGNRVETEANIVKTMLLGKQVNIHQALVPKLALVEAQVRELALTQKEVSNFIETLAEIGGYSWRTVAGTNRNSNHSYGLALDILPKNWKNKPMYWDWINDFNDNWMLLPQSKLWTPPEAVIKTFQNNGFIWGGTWDIYDTMHFEYRPELIELSKNIVF